MSLPLFDVHGHCMPAAYRDAILASPIGKTARSLADNLVRKGVAVVVAGGGVR
jgi:hypothetical protein